MAGLKGQGLGDTGPSPEGRQKVGLCVRHVTSKANANACVQQFIHLSGFTALGRVYLACSLLEQSEGSLFQLPLGTSGQLGGRGSLWGLEEVTETVTPEFPVFTVTLSA